jgi:predicted DNA-binding transcriptional regulator YafY
MNRIDRMFATILLLQSRRVIKAEEIAAHFEISLRTVYRDVAALSEAGVPVVAEAGVGYSLLKNYLMPPVMFTPEEASALFLGGELVDHLTDPSMQTQMRSALLKILSVLPQAQQDHLERLNQSTALFIGHPQDQVRSRGTLTQIQNALAQRRALALDYCASGRDETTRREVEPLGLIYYGDHWHLIAYCRLRRDYRDFRTDRIVRLAANGTNFQPHPNFSVREYINSWREKAPSIKVKVKFSARAAERARRSCFAGTLEERRIAGGVEMTFPVCGLEWISTWLVSFGTEAEVLAPPELRPMVAEYAFKLAEHHSRRSVASQNFRPTPKAC